MRSSLALPFYVYAKKFVKGVLIFIVSCPAFIYPFSVSAFKMIEGNHAAMQKFVYFLGNIVGMLLALYKCQSMGLLPSHSSDWLAFIDPPVRLEYSGGGISLL